MNNLNYGIIGNCRTAALISKTGSIDWCCLPEFNSSSIFAKLLDTKIGGSFEIIADDHYQISQSYIPNTNLLLTDFSNGPDHFQLIDFMPRYKTDNYGHHYPPDIIRYFKHKSGRPVFKIKYNPKLEFAKYTTESVINGGYIKSFTLRGTYDSLYLYSDLDHAKIITQKDITLEKDSFCLISYNQKIERQDQHKIYIEMHD